MAKSLRVRIAEALGAKGYTSDITFTPGRAGGWWTVWAWPEGERFTRERAHRYEGNYGQFALDWVATLPPAPPADPRLAPPVALTEEEVAAMIGGAEAWRNRRP